MIRGLCGMVAASLAAVLVSLPAAAEDWWRLPDAEFATRYAGMAFSDRIEDRSAVAWMLFARLVLPGQGAEGGPLWRSWPSNPDTFRTPDLLVNDEEIRRNPISHAYLTQNGLTTADGVDAFLRSGQRVDLPVGAIEAQAQWADPQGRDGTYQTEIDDRSLAFTGIQFMVKMRPAPADQFSSEAPSWFMTAFEWNGNPNLAKGRSLITYTDALDTSVSAALMQAAGLGQGPFMNYSLNGTQIRFSDAAYGRIVLGESTMEEILAVQDQVHQGRWIAWNSSCHTCHATAAYSLEDGDFFDLDLQIGAGRLGSGRMAGYRSLDFLWSIPKHAE